MKRQLAFITALFFSIILQGCYSQGSSAPAPTNVNVTAGDSSATVTWDMVPSVEYWIFRAAASDVTPASCSASLQCQILTNAVSPAVVSGLTNGTTYSFSVNGRIDGGKGGPGSPSIQAIPRLAGAIWTTGAQQGVDDLHGITYGLVYVAVGNNGASFSSTNGINWTAFSSPLPAVNFTAVAYFGGKYVAVGLGGAIYISTDTLLWQQQNSNTSNDLYAITSNGVNTLIATGANGTILTSSDGSNWTTQTSGTSNSLYGVAYANGEYVAVGGAGTILTSSNIVTWQAITPGSSANLRTITYGTVAGATVGTTAPMFVALGDAGTLFTSSDAVTWTAQTSIAANPQINSVTFGHQFVAVANNGGIFTSTDGANWALSTTAPSPLYAVYHGPYDYTAVGTGGLNMHSN